LFSFASNIRPNAVTAKSGNMNTLRPSGFAELAGKHKKGWQ
jgi:hypothetical protein